jgi:hypothetical protein
MAAVKSLIKLGAKIRVGELTDIVTKLLTAWFH